MKKITAFVLSLVTVLMLVLASCGTGGKNGPSVTSGLPEVTHMIDSQGSDTVEPGSAYLDASGKYFSPTAEENKYEGREFRIWTNSPENNVWYDMDFSVTGDSENAVESATYRRISETEGLLGVKISALPVGAWIGVDEELRSVLSGTNEFEALMTNVRSAAVLSREGFFADLRSTEIQLDAPWWDQNLISDLEIGKSLYMTTGDISIGYKKSLSAIMFNQNMINDYIGTEPFGNGDLYSLVEKNDWSWDRLISMSKAIGKDVNGNGREDVEDVYGYLFFNDSGAIDLIGCGIKMISKDNNGKPVDTFWNERTVSAWEKLVDLFYSDFASYNGEWKTFDNTNMYLNNQVCFLALELHSIEDFRNMQADFGILPLPKFTEDQEYATTVNPNVACLLAIPKNCPDTEFVSTVLDVLGAKSKNYLTPAYCDSYMTRVYRDERMLDMLEIVFSTVSYDMGYMYNWGGIGLLAPLLIYNKGQDLSSEYAAIKELVAFEIENAISDYASLEKLS